MTNYLGIIIMVKWPGQLPDGADGADGADDTPSDLACHSHQCIKKICISKQNSHSSS